MSSTNNYYEQIEDYLQGRLSEIDREQFEVAVQIDANLRETVEKQRLLFEGIKLAALQQERERLKAMHEAINEKKTAGGKIVRAERRFKVRKAMSMVGLLVIGMWFGGILVDKMGNKSPTRSYETPGKQEQYGNNTDDLPFFNSKIRLVRSAISEYSPTTSTGDIDLSIVRCSPCTETYRLEGNKLQYFLPVSSVVKFSDKPQLFLLELKDLEIEVAILKKSNQLDQHIQIPLKHEDFQKIWNL